MSYLTKSEEAAIQNLDRSTPYYIRGVSQTQFNITQHYNTYSFQGHNYFYIPSTDELIRNNVLKFVNNLRKKQENNKPIISSSLF